MSSTIVVSTPTGTAVAAQQPPITHIFQVIFTALSGAAPVVSFLFRWATRIVGLPIWHGLVRPLLYILAPVIVLLHVLYTVFVATPYNVVVGIANTLYPLYVFLGVACLCGAFVGYFGNALATVVTGGFLEVTKTSGINSEKMRASSQIREKRRINILTTR